MLSIRLNPLNPPEEILVHGELNPEVFYSKLTAITSGVYTLPDPSNDYVNHMSWKIVKNISNLTQQLTPDNGTSVSLPSGSFVGIVWCYDNDETFIGQWYNIRGDNDEEDVNIIGRYPLDEPELISTNTELSITSYMSEISGNRVVSLPDATVRGVHKLILTQGGANVTVTCSLEGSFSGFDLGSNNKAHLVWGGVFWLIIDSKGLVKIPIL